MTIYLIDNGFHSDLWLPTAALEAAGGPIAKAARTLTPSPWVGIGWGDAKFFTATGFDGARAVDALRAMFAPGNPSVIRLTAFPLPPERAVRADEATPLRLSRPGFAALLRRLDASARLDGSGAPVRSRGVPQAADERYVDSVEHFSAAHLCNHWIGEALNAAGLATTPVLDTLPAGLKLDLQLRDRAPPERAR